MTNTGFSLQTCGQILCAAYLMLCAVDSGWSKLREGACSLPASHLYLLDLEGESCSRIEDGEDATDKLVENSVAVERAAGPVA